MISLHGRVSSGLGRGAGFMGLPWVREGIHRLTGFHPYPGTFNVRFTEPGVIETWHRIRQAPGLRLEPPAPDQCGARLFLAVVEPDVTAAVIEPDVTDHGGDVIELVAAVHVRRALGLRDDDPVTLRIPGDLETTPG